jgi:7,8-didemethyl-8-hydroxy-5-deazariboflavin synthase CofG subunit
MPDLSQFSGMSHGSYNFASAFALRACLFVRDVKFRAPWLAESSETWLRTFRTGEHTVDWKHALLARANNSETISDEIALSLASPNAEQVEAVRQAACHVRQRAWGSTLTFSPKVFLPLTNLCRNRCDYCSFRRSPGDEGAWTMNQEEVDSWLQRAHQQGCVEALFCLGDKPESGFSSYRNMLATWGFQGTVDYLVWSGELALQRGLLPHTNAGVLTREDMQRLKQVNVSLGLMLENSSPRLCEKGMPHYRAPDKRPQRRIQMIAEAGEEQIPFTTGILIGIGETPEERVQSLLVIRDLHRQYGHIQEIIVQNFRAFETTPMAQSPEANEAEILYTVSLARLLMPDDVSIQAPPNLNPESTIGLIQAGLNDFGGISPVTPDYINPGHPWPHLQALSSICQTQGFQLQARLPVYDRYLERPGFVTEQLQAKAYSTQEALSKQSWWQSSPVPISVPLTHPSSTQPLSL